MVVLGALVSLEVVLEALRVVGDVRTLGRVQVVDHAMVEGEQRRRSTNLSTHVANRSHTRAGERLDAGASVLDDGTGTALYREDAGNLEDDIYFKTLVR